MTEVSKSKDIYGVITSLHRGGAERQMLYLLDNDVVSDLFLLENKIEYDINPEKSKSIKPLILSNKIKSPFLKYLLIPFYSFKFSKKINKNSTVISFVERADLTNIFSKIFKKHKSVVSILTNPLKAYKGLKLILFPIMMIVYFFSDMLIVNSKGAAKFIKRFIFLKDKTFTIYNPISIDFIEQKKKELLNDEEKRIFINYPVFINVARLTDAKGQWHLLRIFKMVKENITNAKLVIVGDGKLRNYLVSLSKELGLKTFTHFNNENFNESYDVYFFGSQENPFKYIYNSSIFVFTSLFEGFANVILEALVCEVPVISADCRFGPREILAPETDFMYETKTSEYGSYGVLMPILDERKKTAKDFFSKEEIIWSKTIVDLYKNKTIRDRYTGKSIERVKDFDINVIIPEWDKLLNN